MLKLCYIFVFVGTILAQALTIQSQCTEERGNAGNIFHSLRVRGNSRDKGCCKIRPQTNRYVKLRIDILSLDFKSCNDGYLRITEKDTEEYTFCHNNGSNRKPILASKDVEVSFYLYNNQQRESNTVGFKIDYQTHHIDCGPDKSFHCTSYLCIPKTQVCNGVKDCENGVDEVGCVDAECAREGSFHCTNLSCIPKTQVCNGVKDCENGLDEVGCVDEECARKGSFHCTNLSCIPETQVCDGVKDCENGADEVECETGVVSMAGVAEARSKAIAWLKSRRSSSWGWLENTPNAVTALFLANGVAFNGTDLEEELMAKQTELKAAVALLKKPISNEQLSIIINSLLVTCHSPRDFYGQNLVKHLKEQIKSSDSLTHPAAYLALCNANESWPMKATTDLRNVLNSSSEYFFIKDIQAFAVMAVSCHTNNQKVSNKKESTDLMSQYEKIIKRFKKHQLSDGSFGNVHSTSLITQALISSGEEDAIDWQLNATIKYLIQELNASHVDILANTLTLPVLNGKSLVDIVKINCSENLRKHGHNDHVSEYMGPKIRVQYSLYVGDEKDVIHTISLKVPENLTAYKVMQMAELKDQNYQFKWKRISGKTYVFRIGKVTNDPEAGMFWLLYLRSSNKTDVLNYSFTSPDHLHLKDGDHLIMWYRKAEL